MVDFVLSLGSNLGGRYFNIRTAINTLSSAFGIEVLKVSPFYETEPVIDRNTEGYAGGQYVNCCVFSRTSLKPYAILGLCFGIEASLGRRRQYRSAPRTIDMDIIFYEDLVLNETDLVIPHKNFACRSFVLAPLGDIFPEYKFKNFDFADSYKSIDWNLVKRVEEYS
jgi:2-amino-4-hydroxy-6-hydroxymethyldihydropteridine diphosphokinase